ncbi:DDB1- and CUL4-associated factor 17 isoform X3 [Nothobranchius furzeri]|uniref:DDB1- and CUL4-associated factor 17 isoform X3 n=1 Tax=Nothobranchius furzeri TaxID=105023 RepID=UPI0024040ED7|nr:DDB1- and CUL4-associated factor 17 isoform X3 [Nothobranchius furzeri]
MLGVYTDTHLRSLELSFFRKAWLSEGRFGKAFQTWRSIESQPSIQVFVGVLAPVPSTLLRFHQKGRPVAEENRSFVKVWSKTSKSPVMYENGKIYFDNYQNCYSCVHAVPQILYKMPKRSTQEKIEDALLCESPLEQTLPTSSDHNPSLLVLTANNWLLRLSAETGKELQSVYLSPNYKFKYLGWDSSQEIFYVKSVQNKETPLSRQVAGVTHSAFMYLGIFRVFPLQIVGILEINKKGFGSGITDVLMHHGVLAVSHSNKKVKMYSIEHIVQRYLTEELTLGKQSSLLGGKKVGEFPCGIPVNIQVTDSIPVLFEVTSNNGVQVGGNPWHYIYSPAIKQQRETHHICSLKDSTLATNGIQNLNCYSLESDVIFFHPTNSSSVVHIGPTIINFLKIVGEVDSPLPSKIVKDFSLTTSRKPSSRVTVTSSGRTVKKRFQQLDDDPSQENFRILEFEDELDLLAVVVTNGEGDEGRSHIQLHDNLTGQFHRKIDLVECWDETYPHQMFFDRDTIIHIEQRNTNFCCHVYKLKTTRK